MTTLGPDTCPQCRHVVLLLPLSSGKLEAFDPRAFPLDQVDEGDRFVVRAPRGAAEPLIGDDPVATCLRRHRCEVDQSPTEPVIPPESPRPPTPPAVATRSDFQGLRQLRTSAELLRLQTLGQLRHHAGSRHYSPGTVPAGLAALTSLDEHHCILCRRQLEPTEQLAVATVDGTTTVLSVCLPTCRGRE